MAYWAAARVRTDQTRRAVWHIERQHFETYLPMCRASRRSLRTVPLFPGYIFVCIVDQWHCLLGTVGVIDVIRSGDVPARVREDEIERIKANETRDGVIILLLVRFQPGERVRMLRGPLADRVGIYAGMSARDRIKVMFTLFEREVSIELRESDVAAV
jgi:transcription antitermination factor NusG